MNKQEAEIIALTELNKYSLFNYDIILMRNKRRYGYCDYNKKLIALNEIMLNDEEQFMDTLRHEIAHAIAGPVGHNAKWKLVCSQIGAEPKRCGKPINIPKKYTIWCPKCNIKLCERHRFPRKGSYHIDCKTRVEVKVNDI